MKRRRRDAIVVLENAKYTPPMYYFTGGGHVSHATMIKKRAEAAVLFHGDMERDEAAKSGLKLISYSKYDIDGLVKKAKGDFLLANALGYELIFKEMGITTGRVGVYGTYDIGTVFGRLTHLQKLMPQIEFVGEAREESIFMRAMETKDESEVERIRKMGKITTDSAQKVAENLTSREVNKHELLVKEDSTAL